MKNRNWLLLLLFTTTLISFVSCTKDPNTAYLGNWIQHNISPLGGVPRSGACCFVIGDTVYVGLGKDNQNNVLIDWWKWGVTGNVWLPVNDTMRYSKDTLITGRQMAAAFSIDGIGYVGTGESMNGTKYYNDFFSYNPATQKFTFLSKDPFKGTARFGCVGFSINHLGFIGGGYNNNYLGDYYKFNPSLPEGQRWSLAGGIGEKRVFGGVFIIGTKAYICTGSYGAALCDDMVIYDSSTDKWRESDTTISSLSVTAGSFNSDYTDIMRLGAALFSVNGKGYVTWGGSLTGSTSNTGKTWEYDPGSGLWTRKTTFPVSQSGYAVGAYTLGFTVNGEAFVGTGTTGSSAIDNFYQFLPDTQYVPGD